MLVTGNVSPRTRRRTDPVISHKGRYKGSAGLPQTTHSKASPFRPPPRDVFFSIEESRPSGEAQVNRTRPNSRQCADPMREYFPRVSSDHDLTSPREHDASQAQSRCESVPLLDADADSFNNLEDTATRSVTAPPNVSLELSDLADLKMNVDDMATVVLEEEQQKYKVERRQNISSAMGSRQHGHTRMESLSGTPRRKLLNREQAYLVMKCRERPCLRTESFLDEDLYNKVNNMSRECCDVLGPRACHECDRLNRRSNSALRNEANFPSIHISAANFSTLTLVNRVRPELSSRQVLERLAHGDISRQSVRRKNSTEQRRNSTSGDDDPAPPRKTSVSAFKVPDGLGYFTNFTDLRAQIFAQKQQMKHGTKTDRFKKVAGAVNNNLPVITNVEVVPKKDWERENSANYFGPPMLSRAEIERQKSQPRFYAGAQGKYELPEAPSFDEIALKATGARDQRLRKVRSDTPDSDVSMWSLKSSPKDEQAPSGETKTETSANEDVVTEPGIDQNVMDVDS